MGCRMLMLFRAVMLFRALFRALMLFRMLMLGLVLRREWWMGCELSGLARSC
jgi:hypothetical protein